MIAALYVESDGAYFGLDGVEPWDEAKDAISAREKAEAEHFIW